MTSKPVVAGTDGSEESLQAVEWAAREAALRGAGLRIVSVAELLPRMGQSKSPPGVDTVTDVLRENRDHALATAAQRAAALAPELSIDTGALAGPIAQAVTDSGSGAALLVVGSRGIGAFAAMILGSVSRFAATHASCPVVVVRDQPTAVQRQIGVGIRDGDSSAGTLEFAFEEAALRQAGLTVIHAWHSPHDSLASNDGAEGASRQLTELLASWRDKYPGVAVTQNVVHGHPGRVLAGFSAHADLIIIGRRAADEAGGRGPGTVRHALLNHAHGSVITVPAS